MLTGPGGGTLAPQQGEKMPSSLVLAAMDTYLLRGEGTVGFRRVCGKMLGILQISLTDSSGGNPIDTVPAQEAAVLPMASFNSSFEPVNFRPSESVPSALSTPNITPWHLATTQETCLVAIVVIHGIVGHRIEPKLSETSRADGNGTHQRLDQGQGYAFPQDPASGEDLSSLIHLISTSSQPYGGRLLTHHNVLSLSFPAASQAVAWAVHWHHRLWLPPFPSLECNLDRSKDPTTPSYRIGIHLGEVQVGQETQAQAHHVAQVLATLAEPGGICLSRAIYDTVLSHLTLYFADGGLQYLQGIAHPLRVYQLSPLAIATAPQLDPLDPDLNLTVIAFTTVENYQKKLLDDQAHCMACSQRDFALMWQKVVELGQPQRAKVVQDLGHGLVLVFHSATLAMAWAMETQQLLAAQRDTLMPEETLSHSIGLHLGDLVTLDQEVLGDAVSLAARLLTHAPSNGICLSRALHDVLAPHLAAPFLEDQRQLVTFQGMNHPVGIYPLAFGQMISLSHHRPQELPWGQLGSPDQPTPQNPSAGQGAREKKPEDPANPDPPFAVASSLLAAYGRGDRNFAAQDLRHLDLRGATLRGARLRGCNFNQGQLAGADLTGTDLSQATLLGANLEQADLHNAFCRYTNFSEANLQGANLRYANLLYSHFHGANLRGADLTGATILALQLEQAIVDETTVLPPLDDSLWLM